MSCNRFGTFLGLAHAATTAEGDNSVLMQKVAKERLGQLIGSGALDPTNFGKPMELDEGSVTQRVYHLLQLLEWRERLLFLQLMFKTKEAGKDGIFNTWMLEESDLIQSAARAYGENLIAKRFATVLAEQNTTELNPILEKILTLYAATVVERNLNFFMTNKQTPMETTCLVTPVEAREIKGLVNTLCDELGPQALALCQSFAITDTMLSAPIALDWVKYNTYDNQGELMTKEEWNRTVMSKK